MKFAADALVGRHPASNADDLSWIHQVVGIDGPLDRHHDIDRVTMLGD